MDKAFARFFSGNYSTHLTLCLVHLVIKNYDPNRHKCPCFLYWTLLCVWTLTPHCIAPFWSSLFKPIVAPQSYNNKYIIEVNPPNTKKNIMDWEIPNLFVLRIDHSLIHHKEAMTLILMNQSQSSLSIKPIVVAWRVLATMVRLQ